MSAAAKWLPSVGLEIHAQVLSRNKLLSNGPTLNQGKRPNTAVDLFDIALPGTMPVCRVHNEYTIVTITMVTINNHSNNSNYILYMYILVRMHWLPCLLLCFDVKMWSS